MPKLSVLPGRPPKYALDNFREALNLPTGSLEQANTWFRANPDFVQQFDLNDTIRRAAEETKLDVSELGPLFSLIANVGLFLEDDSKLPLLLEDLREIGLSDAQIANFEVLVRGLRFPEGKVTSATVQTLLSGIPRVVDFTAVCDLRGVFEAAADSRESDENIARLIAVVPVVILTLDVQQESGRVDSVIMQFSEDELTAFQKKLSRASLQLARLGQIKHR